MSAKLRQRRTKQERELLKKEEKLSGSQYSIFQGKDRVIVYSSKKRVKARIKAQKKAELRANKRAIHEEKKKNATCC